MDRRWKKGQVSCCYTADSKTDMRQNQVYNNQKIAKLVHETGLMYDLDKSMYMASESQAV